MKPHISVIVTAFHRKDFIRKAIMSAIQQDLDRAEYEIIAVNNFDDHEFEQFCRENGVMSVKYENDRLGAMLAVAIRAAKGNIICFLDDDDLFSRDKLRKVKELFDHYTSLTYYHNDGTYIDEEGNNIEKLNKLNDNGIGKILLDDGRKNRHYREFINSVHRFGSSCISVRSTLLEKHLDEIQKIRVSPDIFITTCALLSDGAVYSDNSKLVFYRISRQQWSGYRNDLSWSGMITIHSRASDSAYGYGILSEIATKTQHVRLRRYVDSVYLARTASASILNPVLSRKSLASAWHGYVKTKGLFYTIRLISERASRFAILSSMTYFIAPGIARSTFMKMTPTI